MSHLGLQWLVSSVAYLCYLSVRWLSFRADGAPSSQVDSGHGRARYDKAGRVTSEATTGATTTFVYNAAGLLTGQTGPNRDVAM
ncbi:MAG: RHS repeat protein [Actinobacteria bacterium]|nr:RHS repeat protein [Actinomycetota bacterium]